MRWFWGLGERSEPEQGAIGERVSGKHSENEDGTALFNESLRSPLPPSPSFGQIFIAKSISPNNGFLLNLLLSSTIGSFFCFGFQSLNHILMHSTMPYHLKMPLALLASACSPMPWFSYYIAGGHQRHHMNAGSETDIDREALFWIWEKVRVLRLGARIAEGWRRVNFSLPLLTSSLLRTGPS